MITLSSLAITEWRTRNILSVRFLLPRGRLFVAGRELIANQWKEVHAFNSVAQGDDWVDWLTRGTNTNTQ